MIDSREQVVERATLAELRALPMRLLVMPKPATDADVVDEIEALERAKSAISAAQARLADDLADRRASRSSASAELGLARHESPYAGQRLLRLAQALVHDLPHTYGALWAGDLNERRAQIVAHETSFLSRADRLRADAELADKLAELGDKELAAAVRRLVMRLDPEAAVRRREKALGDRRVTGKLLGDGTGEVTAVVSEIDYAKIMQALEQVAQRVAAEGDERTRGQIKSDHVVQQLTGDAPASGSISVQLVVSAETLLGDGDEPGHVPGVGPIPAPVARRFAFADEEQAVTLRRLFAVPHDGTLITMESAARLFPPVLRHFLRMRDDVCRTPWCNAPIAHADHIRPAAEGGPTSVHNGQGLCATCNYIKEEAGWRHDPVSEELDPHVVEVTTPSGHTYRSRAPDLPHTA